VYKVEVELHLRVREQKRLNTTGLQMCEILDVSQPFRLSRPVYFFTFYRISMYDTNFCYMRDWQFPQFSIEDSIILKSHLDTWNFIANYIFFHEILCHEIWIRFN
jgi:hypothetical protein